MVRAGRVTTQDKAAVARAVAAELDRPATSARREYAATVRALAPYLHRFYQNWEW